MINKYVVLFIFIVFSTGLFAQNDSISIVSWNIFMRPAMLNDQQMQRVDSISHYLLNKKTDIIVLQEAFHRKARRRILQQLKHEYPFHTEMGPKSLLGVPSGVLILSRDSIVSVERTSFKKAKGADRFAKKGAVLVTISRNNRRVQVLGTHLQAGGGEKRNRIRKGQIKRIQKLVKKNDSTTPVIFAGDFNIEHGTDMYNALLDSLNADGVNPYGRFQFTSNFSDHDLFSSSGNAKWIDFILISSKNKAAIMQSWIEEPRRYAEDKKKRLSDHNPIFSKVLLGYDTSPKAE